MAKTVLICCIATCAVALTSVTLPISAAPAPSAATPAPTLSKWQQHVQEMLKSSAPADEYFGRMKLSYLGMNNTFHDSAISSGDHTTDAAIAHKVADAEDALAAWAKKYPRDPQLARTYYLAVNAERKIWLQANQGRAWLYLNQLVHGFGGTYFGKIAKKGLAVGFTEHYYAPVVACATPAPDAAPAGGDAQPSPSPTPATTTLAPGHRVQILPQACIPLPTPSPSPSPSPSASASPATDLGASPTPSPAASSTDAGQ